MMLGRTPADAVNNYVSLIQRLVSCVSDAVASVDGGYYVSDTSHALRLNRGRSVRISGTTNLQMAFQQYYRIVETEVQRTQWIVIVEGYEYKLLDTDGKEILIYHWHPRGQGAIAFHHLHIGHGAEVSREELQTAHLPTGYVSVADILRLLITDFRASPRRDDWESILGAFQ